MFEALADLPRQDAGDGAAGRERMVSVPMSRRNRTAISRTVPFTQNAVWDSQTVKKDLLENNVYRLIRNAPEEKLNRPFPTQHQTIGQWQ